MVTETATAPDATCANCAAPLTGQFCANCGQNVRDLQRPFRAMFADAIGDVFSLDTRFARTLWPLLTRPGQVTKDYLSGRRAAHVPPLRMYLIAALLFFGLFSMFPPKSPPVYLYTIGSAEETLVKQTSARGGRVTIGLPSSVWLGDRQYQDVRARARANPEAFAQAGYRNIPRAFFLFLPVFAAMLGLFYWRPYYVDHLVFALYYQAFLFLAFALVFLAGWLPGFLKVPLRTVLVLWPIVYLPIAARRVYGGSRLTTVAKTAGVFVLYVLGFVIFGFAFIAWMAVLTF